MSGGFRALPASDLARSLEEMLLPRLTDALHDRAPGHCMRVSDLGPDLMVALATGLRSQAPSANVHVLSDDTKPDDDLHISSTKLVELRNPRADGSLRPPVCIFLPANLRTSAEDSFGKATFEEFTVGDAYATLRQQLLKRVPSTLYGYVRDYLRLLEERRWRWAGSAAQVRYLLCAQANGNDGEAFGGALYELGLVPDFKLFDDPPAAYGRVSRNQECVASLTDGDTSVLGRVLDLELTNPGLRRRLAEYLGDTGVEDPVAWTRDVVLDRKNWDISFDKWAFGSEIAPDRIAFVRVETDLPVVPDDGHENERLADLAGQQVLTPTERRKIGVVLEVSPHPGRVRGTRPLHGADRVAGDRTGRRLAQGQGLESGQGPRHGVAAQAQPRRLRRRLAPRTRAALDHGRRSDPDGRAGRTDRETHERERAVLRAAGWRNRRRTAPARRTQSDQRRACSSRSPVRCHDAAPCARGDRSAEHRLDPARRLDADGRASDHRSQVRHRRRFPDTGGALAEERRATHPRNAGATLELADAASRGPAAHADERRGSKCGIRRDARVPRRSVGVLPARRAGHRGLGFSGARRPERRACGDRLRRRIRRSAQGSVRENRARGRHRPARRDRHATGGAVRGHRPADRPRTIAGRFAKPR